MKKTVLFVHDHIFVSDDTGNVYSPGIYPGEHWHKYLRHFDRVNVVGRHGGVVEKPQGRYVLSSHPNVSFSFVKRISTPVSLIKNLSAVRQQIEAQVCASDAVIARLPSENGLLAVGLARKYGKPCCVEVVGCAFGSLWDYGRLTAKLYAPLAYIRTRRAVAQADFCLYVTESFLQGRYPHSATAQTVVASNVNIKVAGTKISELKRQRYSKKLNKVRFGLIGNFKTKYKGIHLVLDALAGIDFRSLGVDYEFRVLGNGNPDHYLAQAERLGIRDKVFFDGLLPAGDAVAYWLDHIDVYLQPSLQEGLPRALIEAMSRGCVAIGSTTGGIPELLEPAFIHQTGSVKGLIENIQFVLSDECNRIRASERNFNQAMKYDSNVISSRRAGFFDALARRS